MTPGDDRIPQLSGVARGIRAQAGRTPLVGRDRERAVIDNERDAVSRGEARVVMLVGEAGIGKSRMMRSACAAAASHGDTILVGRCVDEQGMPPFFPWITAFSNQPAEHHHFARLASLLSGDDRPTGQEAGWTTPEQRKLRVFAEVADQLIRLARTRPVLIAIDDLQWSDAASNELLRYVLLRAESTALMVLGTFRDDEATANTALQHTLDELHRQRLLTTLSISPLSVADTCRHVIALTGRDDERLARAIHNRCEGNPFFIEEVLRELAERRQFDEVSPSDTGQAAEASPDPWQLPVPRSVVSVIERRLSRASASCRSVLELAALIGKGISVDLLAEITGDDAASMTAFLEEAAGLALVAPGKALEQSVGDVTQLADYAFLHDRVRESIEGTIGLAQRRQFHKRIAAALETTSLVTDEIRRLSAVTHHLREARDHHRAAEVAERLGDAAMQAHAHFEAAAAYRTAIELAPSTDLGDHKDLASAMLQFKLADALLATGNEEDAVTGYTHAEHRFARSSDTWNRARSLRRLGMAHARLEHFDTAIEQYRTAIDVLQGVMGDVPAGSNAGAIATELAMTLVELGEIEGTSLARYDDGARHGQAGLDLATREADANRHLEPYARLSLAKTLIRAGSLTKGHAILAPALSLALQYRDDHLAAEIAGALANYHYWTGDLTASSQFAQQRQELARDIHDPFLLRHITVWRANLALARGDWPEANRLLDVAERQVARLDSPEPHAFIRMIRGLVLYQQGQYQESVAQLESAIGGFRASGPATVIWYLGCLAQVYLDTDNHELLRHTLDEVRAMVTTLPSKALPHTTAVAQLGIVAARMGDVEAAGDLFATLHDAHGQHHWVIVDRVLAMLATTFGDTSAAERFFTSAVAMATRGGIQPELALTLAEHGTALSRSSDPDRRARGQSMLRDAITRLEQLGMRGALTRYGDAPTDSDAVESLPAGLTNREADVLVLLTHGLTNREIGDRLSISEKTVTNHLTHIFTKANVENRSAAVAFALRHGLSK